MNLFRLQKRALRLCSGMNSHSSESLFSSTNKLSLFNIHDFLTAQLIFKYFLTPHIVPNAIVSLFTKSSDIYGFHTRSSDSLALHIHLGKLHVRASSLKIYGAFLWNKIPLTIRLLPNLYSLKKTTKVFFKILCSKKISLPRAKFQFQFQF